MENQKPVSKLFTLSFAHLVNDWYMNFIQAMMPMIVAEGFTPGQGGFLVSVFTITSSLLQPVIGYAVDRKNQKWFIYVGTLFMAILLSLFGLVKSYPLLLTIVGVAGIGTAAFHPQASAMTAAISSKQKRATYQAFFIACGNVGFALTTLIAVPIVARYGLGITPVFVIPGLIAAAVLAIMASSMKTGEKKEYAPLRPALKAAWRGLLILMLIVAFRSLAYFGMVSYLSLYLKERGVSTVVSGQLLFVMLFAGALGGVVGGVLADKIGKKPVLVSSLILAGIFFIAFMNTAGVLSYIFMAVAGFALLSSFSITVVLAQSLISKNAAMASGLMLGFGTGMGGLGVGLLGILADTQGVGIVITLLSFVPFMGAVMGLFLKKEKHKNNLV